MGCARGQGVRLLPTHQSAFATGQMVAVLLFYPVCHAYSLAVVILRGRHTRAQPCGQSHNNGRSRPDTPAPPRPQPNKPYNTPRSASFPHAVYVAAERSTACLLPTPTHPLLLLLLLLLKAISSPIILSNENPAKARRTLWFDSPMLVWFRCSSTAARVPLPVAMLAPRCPTLVTLRRVTLAHPVPIDAVRSSSRSTWRGRAFRPNESCGV